MKIKTLIASCLIALMFACATAPRTGDVLKEKYANTPTADLKLRHHQLEESIPKSQWWVGGLGLLKASETDDKRTEKEEIENELLRRWKAGDKGAYLPIFQ